MKRWIWLLPALALGSVMPGAQAQPVMPYDPRPIGPYGPTPLGGFGPMVPQGPAPWSPPGRYDPRNPSLAPQPWMSPTLQGIYRDAQNVMNPWPGPGSYGPDPRASLPSSGPWNTGVPDPIPGLNPPPPSPPVRPAVPPAIDPRVFEPHPFVLPPGIGKLEPMPAARMPAARMDDPGPPAWFSWKYAAGIFLIAALLGTIYQVFRRDSPAQ